MVVIKDEAIRVLETGELESLKKMEKEMFVILMRIDKDSAGKPRSQFFKDLREAWSQLYELIYTFDDLLLAEETIKK